MAANRELAAQLGKAWAYHRQGNNDSAIQEFSAILNSEHNNVDALYGLGLAQRASGKASSASESFKKALQGVNAELAKQPGVDRFEMLQRMITQRLAELGGSSIA